MANKKRLTTVNNIQELNVEIDYDKLADAIVRAEKSVRPEKKNAKFRTALLNVINGVIYISICIFAICGIFLLWHEFYISRTPSLVTCVFVSGLLALLAVYSFLCQQESTNDKEENALNYFQANMSLVALIVALCALLLDGVK